MGGRRKRERRPATDTLRPGDEGLTEAPAAEETIFERAIEETLAGLPFDEGAGFSYIFWRLRPGKTKEYCGRYTPPPDLDLWHRELGGGEYLLQVQRHGKFTDIPGIKLSFGERPGVTPAAAPTATTVGGAGQAMQDILGLLKDRAAVEAAKAAIAEKQEGFGTKEMLELFAAFRAMTPDTLTQFKTVADLLASRERREAAQPQRGPYDDVMAKMLTTVVERGITGGGEPSVGVEIIRALLNPEALREIGRTFQGAVAIATGKMRGPAMPPAAPAGQFPTPEAPPVSEQPTTGEGSTGTPQRGIERLVQEILAMVQGGDRDFDHLAACADRWTPGLCEQIAAAEKEAAVAHITQTIPPLNTPQAAAFLSEFYVYLKQQPEEGTDAGN